MRVNPEISPADRQECRDRPPGEISGLGRLRCGPCMEAARARTCAIARSPAAAGECVCFSTALEWECTRNRPRKAAVNRRTPDASRPRSRTVRGDCHKLREGVTKGSVPEFRKTQLRVASAAQASGGCSPACVEQDRSSRLARGTRTSLLRAARSTVFEPRTKRAPPTARTNAAPKTWSATTVPLRGMTR